MAPASTPSPIRLLDGGLGTLLEDRYSQHFSAAETPLWSSHLLADDAGRRILQSAQSDFARAGANIIETATYQVSAGGFAKTKVSGSGPGIGISETDIPIYLNHAVSIAEAAAASAAATPSTTTAVALSLGPYGACMIPSTEYSGVYDAPGRGADALYGWHAQRLRWFAAVPGVATRAAYLAFETLPRRDEIEAVRRVMGSSSQGAGEDSLAVLSRLPFWISCVFPDGNSLPDGTTAEDAVEAMLGVKDNDGELSGGSSDSRDTIMRCPWAIGINCTKLEKLPRLVERYEAAVAKLVDSGHLPAWPALVIYPDGTAAGEVYDTVTQQWWRPGHTEDAAGDAAAQRSWAEHLGDLALAAAKRGNWKEIIVGGCCKASDSDIRALRRVVSTA